MVHSNRTPTSCSYLKSILFSSQSFAWNIFAPRLDELSKDRSHIPIMNMPLSLNETTIKCWYWWHTLQPFEQVCMRFHILPILDFMSKCVLCPVSVLLLMPSISQTTLKDETFGSEAADRCWMRCYWIVSLTFTLFSDSCLPLPVPTCIGYSLLFSHPLPETIPPLPTCSSSFQPVL